MVVYTRKGDKGQTGLYNLEKTQNRRVSKNSLIISTIGAVDEVNSYLGVCANLATDTEIQKKIEGVQRNLFTIGSILAGAKLELQKGGVLVLENEIDEMDAELPVLTGFILPGGSVLSSHLHFARSLTRRLERSLVALSETPGAPPSISDILIYVNRLSDYFFMLARHANSVAKVEEKKWKS